MTDSEFSRYAALSFDNHTRRLQQHTPRRLPPIRDQMGGPTTTRSGRDLWSVITSNGDDVGYLWMQISRDGEYAFLFDIHLGEQARGNGLGRAAMRCCLDTLRSHGVRTLRVSVFEDNLPARSLCASLGFQTEHVDTQPAARWLRLAIADNDR